MRFGALLALSIRQSVRRVAARALIVACLAAAMSSVRIQANDAPLRPAWITIESLESGETAKRAVSSAAASGANTIVVPVSLTTTPRVDGAAEAIREARSRGMRVYAGIQVSRAAGADELPAARDHLLYQHPDWLMLPRDLAVEMRGVDLRSPEYVGRLARWTRANPDRADALYVSPVHPAAVSYLARQLSSVLTRYAVDGVHLQMLQFPGADFDYSRGALDAFRVAARSTLPPTERTRMDAVEAIDPFAYPDEFPDEWRRFRQSRLTALVTELSAVIRTGRPEAAVSVAVAADVETARRDHLQDWTAWVDRGIVDSILQTPAPAVANNRRTAAAGSH
jgi:uncharacterized lipoprotein YddW (UPF0748 family)